MPSDEDEEIEEGDIDDVFGESTDKTRSGGERTKIMSDSGGLDQLDPASYTWGILRYAVVKIALKHIVTFINVAGIELQGKLATCSICWLNKLILLQKLHIVWDYYYYYYSGAPFIRF